MKMEERDFDDDNTGKLDWCDCMTCKHLVSFISGKCAAFDKIPGDILSGETTHKKPYPGDNGIMWELM